jgi:hypothetical protein
MSNLRSAAFLGLGLLLFATCDDDDDDELPPLGVLDAGTVGVLDAGVVVDAGGPTGTCDPVRQDCPAGQQCISGCNVMGVMAKVFTCAVPAAGATQTHGQACGLGCARGLDCFAVPAPNGGTRNVCRQYCNTDADCPGTACVDEGVVCTAGDTAPIGRVCAF